MRPQRRDPRSGRSGTIRRVSTTVVLFDLDWSWSTHAGRSRAASTRHLQSRANRRGRSANSSRCALRHRRAVQRRICPGDDEDSRVEGRNHPARTGRIETPEAIGDRGRPVLAAPTCWGEIVERRIPIERSASGWNHIAGNRTELLQQLVVRIPELEQRCPDRRPKNGHISACVI